MPSSDQSESVVGRCGHCWRNPPGSSLAAVLSMCNELWPKKERTPGEFA